MTQGARDAAHVSSMVAVLWNPQVREGLLIGFIDPQHGPATIRVQPRRENGSLRFDIRASLFVSFTNGGGAGSGSRSGGSDDRVAAYELPPRKTIGAGSLIAQAVSDPLAALESYAETVRRRMDRSFTDPPVVGYMSWYGLRTAIDRVAILRSARIVSDLFGGYPQPSDLVVIVDHGWQEDANWGYWFADADRFPGGLKRPASDLKAQGVTLGVWYTPSCVTEGSPAPTGRWAGCRADKSLRQTISGRDTRHVAPANRDHRGSAHSHRPVQL